MKKLNLELGSIREMLSKEQMKKINGGYCGACINAVGQWVGDCNSQIIQDFCSSGEGLCWVC